MHLVIVSTPRAGAHMLRSMLRADRTVTDIGAFICPDDGRVVEPPKGISAGAVQAVYEREIARLRPSLLLSHVKLMQWHFEAIRAASSTGGRFVFLHRRDHLAQACSLLLAGKYNSFLTSAPAGAVISPDRAQVQQIVASMERLERLGRLYLEGLPHVDLAYEDITRASVSAALAALGVDLKVSEPTTQKSAPRLADFVTNLSELI